MAGGKQGGSGQQPAEGLSVADVQIAEDQDGTNRKPKVDDNRQLLANVHGQTDTGSVVPIRTDDSGRIKVKNVQFDGTVDIGDLQVMNTSEVKIDPATEPTLSSLQTDINNILESVASDELRAKIYGERVGNGTLSAINVDSSGSMKVSELENEPGIRSSNGYTAPGTTFTALSSVSVPDGADVVIEANGPSQNSGNIHVQDTTNNEEVVIRPGKHITVSITDTGNLEWKGDNTGDQAQWYVEG